MTAKLIDGKAVAQSIQQRIKQDAKSLLAEKGVTAGLATVLIGDDPASHTYVGMKQKKCAELGMVSVGQNLPADISQEEALKVVKNLLMIPRFTEFSCSCRFQSSWIRKRSLEPSRSKRTLMDFIRSISAAFP